jgi:hypothetical protein
MRLIIATLGVLAALPRPAHAQPGQDTSYSAIDLAARKITITGIPDGATAGSGLARLQCKISVADGVLTIEHTKEPGCDAIFAARQPPDLRFDLALKVAQPPSKPATPAPPPSKPATPAPPPPKPAAPAPPPPKPAAEAQPTVEIATPLLFDHGSEGLVRAELSDGGLDFKGKGVNGQLAYWSNGRWQPARVEHGTATFEVGASIPDDAPIYFRPDGSKGVLVVAALKPAAPSPPPPPPPLFEETCKKEHLPPHSWLTEIDAANPVHELHVRTPPQIVEPNTFGVIVVRHSDRLVASFDGTGQVQLALPGLRDGSAQSGSSTAPRADIVAAPAPSLTCSTYQVAPRGAVFTVTVSLLDPTKSPNLVSQHKLDILVLQRYAGAFRVGIAGVVGAQDQKFEARTSPESMQGEIVQTSRMPVELVLGYSLYFAGLGGGAGRSYFSAVGQPMQDSHAGLFFGFGVLSIAGTNSIDYLKSIHAGLEWEFSPNFAIAVTAVVRRVDELTAGAMVGGPAPMTIPTQSQYVVGAGLVLNISPSFFKFAANPGK